MHNKIMPFGKRKIEQRLSSMGAKAALAADKAHASKSLCEEANQLLIAVQVEIADLYEEFDDFNQIEK